ncbi:MAG TPA: C1 family peptidase [Xylella sp.]
MTLLKRRKKLGYGYIPDILDIRDFAYIPEALIISALPPKVDLTPPFPVYDQGKMGSCTANALAGAMQFERVHDHQQPEFIPSRLFIYYNERFIEGHTISDSGAMIRDGIKVLHKLGVCQESEWPYVFTPADPETNVFPLGDPTREKPSPQCYKDAQKHKITQYNRVNQDINHLKACLAAGSPFVFGFSVYKSWVGNRPLPCKIPLPTNDDELEGGHAVMCVGYDDQIEHVRIRNSWGSEVGEQGYFWMPYEYISNKKLASDFWVIQTVKS